MGIPPNVATSEIDAIAQSFLKPGAKSIAIAVNQNGKAIFAKAYSDGGPVSPDSVYRIGSLTKQFTAGLIVRLARDHRLSYDDRLSKWIPEVPVLWRWVTLRQLLTHTSGIPAYTDNPSFYLRANSPARPDDTWKMAIWKQDLDFPPGEGWEYSNSNYSILGCVAERATHRKYFDLLQTYFFSPLGMRNTGEETHHPVVPGFDPNGKPGAPIDLSWIYAAGAIVSTANDLAKWDAALWGNRLFTEQEKQEIFTPDPVGLQFGQKYGFGWQILQEGGKTIGVEHNGAINGFNSRICRSFKKGTTVIVLNNTEKEIAEPVADQVLAVFEPDFQADEVPKMADPHPEMAGPDEAILMSVLNGGIEKSAFAARFLADIPFPSIRDMSAELSALGGLSAFKFLAQSGDNRLYAIKIGVTRFKFSITRDAAQKITGLSIAK